jgi:hypothetical protein
MSANGQAPLCVERTPNNLGSGQQTPRGKRIKTQEFLLMDSFGARFLSINVQ